MIPANQNDYRKRSLLEFQLIRRYFPIFTCRLVGQNLNCRGRIKPTEHSSQYRIEIDYRPFFSPDVRVIDPKIEFTPNAHMFKDGTLCLYDCRTDPWQRNWHLYETVIPWTAEWLVFYELFLLTGKWLGKSASHTNQAECPTPVQPSR